MGGLRDYLRQQIQPRQVEQVSGSAALAAYSREVRQAHQEIEDRRKAEAVKANEPEPKSLVDELKSLIGEPEPSEVPGLADARLLQIAAGSQEAPKSVRESLVDALRQHWDKREPQ